MVGSMIAFRIELEQLTLDIVMVEISSVHLHEQTIPEATEELARWLERDGFMRDPIIVDRNSLVVLDGTHRVAAAKRIGCVRLPVCLVDYDSPYILIDTWYRGFKDTSFSSVTDMIRGCRYDLSPIDNESADEEVERRRAIGFLSDSTTYVLISNTELNVHQSYRAVSNIEREARKSSMIIRYETARDATAKLGAGQLDAILGPRKITKDDVKRCSTRDDPFPHKATRHMIPTRPLRIDIPLELLRDKTSRLEDLNKKLVESLEARNLNKLPPGALIEGRRYEEEVFVFE